MLKDQLEKLINQSKTNSNQPQTMVKLKQWVVNSPMMAAGVFIAVGAVFYWAASKFMFNKKTTFKKY